MHRRSEAAEFVRSRGFDGPSTRPSCSAPASARLRTKSSDAVSLAYADIPHFPQSGVSGHAGSSSPARSPASACCCSRAARTTTRTAMPARCACRWRFVRRSAFRSLVLTNAAGSVRPHIRPGSLVAINDHLNLSGINPLLARPHRRPLRLAHGRLRSRPAPRCSGRDGRRDRRCRRASMPGSPGRASRPRPRSAWCRSSAATSSACRRCRR